MDQEPIENQITQGRIYSAKSISAGTLLGGPLVAGYLMAVNYKTFQQPELAKKTWGYAIFATLVIIGLLLLVADPDKIPRQIIPIINAAIVYFLVQNYQGAKIDLHVKNGGLTYKWWNVLGISIVGCVVFLGLVFFLGIFVMN